MNLLHPTSQSVNRAIDIAARVVLVIADIAVIVFLYVYLPFIYIAWAFAAFTLVGVTLSTRKSRWGSFFLLLPVIIFGIYAVRLLYNEFFIY